MVGLGPDFRRDDDKGKGCDEGYGRFTMTVELVSHSLLNGNKGLRPNIALTRLTHFFLIS